ncbi:MAG: FMN-binding glutamate synthase family protein, partial [Planctomycetota bacterium]|nr:FMN-binding glutamate synthase family protein [Planctomycetota bacterium]
KLSQGAKPGHGGILPAAKLTSEIAAIRGVPMGQDVISPPAHSAFSGPKGLLEFVAKLRDLCGGKPVGFKLCVGHRREFLGICKAMVETEILPDFIAVDGAEGGTGAAPIELSNSVGMPMRDGLLFVNSALRGVGLRGKIRVIAAGKIVSGFHMIRAIALGADLCSSARGMMFALGCIQARKCNTNKCPVGITTQDRSRNRGLVVEDKVERVARYHHDTIRSFLELCAAIGLENPAEITPHDVLRRIDTTTIKKFDEIYEYLPEGSLIGGGSLPGNWAEPWRRASADRF